MKKFIFILTLVAFFCYNSSATFGQNSYQTSSGSVKFGDQIWNPDGVLSWDRINLPIIFDSVPPVGAVSLGIEYDPNSFQFLGASAPAGGMFLLGYNGNLITVGWVAQVSSTGIVPQIFDTLTNLMFRYLGNYCDTFSFVHNSLYEVTDINGTSYNVSYGDDIELCWSSHNGINDNLDSKMDFYPNPITDYLQVSLDQSGEYNCIVTDISGRIVMYRKYNGQQFTINLQGISKGIYFLRINEKETLSRKFIIQ